MVAPPHDQLFFVLWSIQRPRTQAGQPGRCPLCFVVWSVVDSVAYIYNYIHDKSAKGIWKFGVFIEKARKSLGLIIFNNIHPIIMWKKIAVDL